jgi:tetrapyrrole methylase family protein/MazG family protein
MDDLISRVLDKTRPPLDRLVDLMAVLRSEHGCAWDRKQTHESLLPYLIEESYEVVEAVENGDYSELRQELGDLLCQVVFHAQIASERGDFTVHDSALSIVEKLIVRHPHVFEAPNKLNPQQVRDQWEQIKLKSPERDSIFGGVPKSMPALNLAFRIGEKAGGLGFDWDNASEVIAKIKEELAEIEQEIPQRNADRLADEIGDLLFASASLSRKLGIDPEQALKKALRKFMDRFEIMSEELAAEGRSFEEFTLEQLEKRWQAAKRNSEPE